MKPESEARAQFEKWAKLSDAGISLFRHPSGRYWTNVEFAWESWQESWQVAYAAGAADAQRADVQTVLEQTKRFPMATIELREAAEAIRARQQTGEQTGKG